MSEFATTAEYKSRLRAEAFARRAAIPRAYARVAAQKIAETGLGFLAPQPGSVISGYYPVRDELDCLGLLHRLASQGYRITLPVVAASRLLHFRLWSPGDPTSPGPFDIPQPLRTAPEADPDLLLLPVLAFDASGRRLGYGGGFYDSTLARLRAVRPRIAIGVAFDEQEWDALPLEPHDELLDGAITPSGLRCFPQAA